MKPEEIHSIWESIGWVGNTLLFLLAGIILSEIHHKITGQDVASVIVVYLLLQIIRLVMICTFYPVLANVGKIKCILLWFMVVI